MRKIEQEMIGAIRGQYNWSKDNTAVVWPNPHEAEVVLHGNRIATVFYDEIQLDVDTLRQWPTATTKSRLRALGCNIQQKDHVLHLDGEAVA